MMHQCYDKKDVFHFQCSSAILILLQFLFWSLKICLIFSLRKVKMDQRKLMDNANTITDMAKVCFETWNHLPQGSLLFISFSWFQTQNNVYEILSDVNSRQDIMDERIANLEDRLNAIQVSMDMLPDLLSRCEPT